MCACRPYIWSVCLLLTLSVACTPEKPSTETKSFFVREEKKPRVVVFVHGVLGDPRATWTNITSGAFFPELLPKDDTFDEADIFVYGFPSPKLEGSYDIDELTEHMRRSLDFAGITKNYEQIVFVCHSMGGLVTRAYLLKYRDEIGAKVPMIYFFSTPSTGSSIAAFAEKLGKNPQFGDMVDIADNTYLGSQQTSWLASTFPRSVRSFCAYEVLQTYGKVIVDRTSATNLCNVRLDPIKANHIDIVKPTSLEDDAFIALKLAYTEAFGASGDPVALDQQSIPNLLASLRSPTRRLSYIVREPLDLSSLAGSAEQWYVMNLTFEDAGVIRVGNRDLKLDVRGKLVASQAGMTIFQAFPVAKGVGDRGTDGPKGANGAAGGGYGDGGQRGGDGEPGQKGEDGLSAGNVEVVLRELPSKAFRISLVGQTGGTGGDGGVGGNGGRGADGRPSESGLFDCSKGGGDGGRGGDGGNGGDAGDGGACGQGGQFVVDAPDEMRPALVAMIKIDDTRSQSGTYGNPGSPGAAGGGGTMGRGGGHCGGGHGGSGGRDGNPGSKPQQGPTFCPATSLVIR